MSFTRAAHYRDRRDAGRALAASLQGFPRDTYEIVLGLPRGGVPVASEIAEILEAPLDVFLVRKLGVPWQEELAMGAIASGGTRVLYHDVAGLVPEPVLEEVTAREAAELKRREQLYLGSRGPLSIRDRGVVVVDDGMATGSSMRAAVAALRLLEPSRITIAVPVASRESCREIEPQVESLLCPLRPDPFFAVGCWYVEFSQTTDGEVRELLRRNREKNEGRN